MITICYLLQSKQGCIDRTIDSSYNDKYIFRDTNCSRRPAPTLGYISRHVCLCDFISYFLRLLGYSYGCKHGCNFSR